MGFSSMHVCMDSSDWLQSNIHGDSGLDSSSPSGEMLACSRPLIERKLRPPHDQALKCPRCDSTHTKFCYYNNYSLSQPRYFCKTCRRYWTEGGTLRNIPVGGGCRKNKKVSAKKSNDQSATSNSVHHGPSYHQNDSDRQLSFPAEVQLSHLSHLLGTTNAALGDSNFMGNKYSIAMLENPRPTGFKDSKYEGIIGNSRNYDFMGNSREHFDLVGGLGDINGHNGLAQSYNSLCSPSFGMDNNAGTYMMNSCQRTMPPYDANEDQNVSFDVKPNPRLLSFDWQDHGKDSFGYLDGLGSWTGMTRNGYGSSSTNPLV